MSLVSTALEIVNVGLTLLGQKKLAALDNTSENGRKMNTIFAPARQQVLKDLRPNFSKTRAIFHHVVQAEKSISAATQADPCVITSAAHGLSVDDVIAIYDVGGMTDLNGKRYLITAVTSDTITLADENENDIDSTEFDAYTSGGKLGLVSAEPAYGFTYRYALPSDYLFLLEINGNEALTMDYSVEGGEILSNDAEMKAQYIADVTDYTKWEVDAVKVLSYKLAAEGAMPITNLSDLAKFWEAEYEKEKAKARGQKSQESGTRSGPPRHVVSNKWLDSRVNGPS